MKKQLRQYVLFTLTAFALGACAAPVGVTKKSSKTGAAAQAAKSGTTIAKDASKDPTVAPPVLPADDKKPDSDKPIADKAATPLPAGMDNLQGVWLTVCNPTKILGYNDKKEPIELSGATQQGYGFRKDKVVKRDLTYSDDKCKTLDKAKSTTVTYLVKETKVTAEKKLSIKASGNESDLDKDSVTQLDILVDLSVDQKQITIGDVIYVKKEAEKKVDGQTAAPNAKPAADPNAKPAADPNAKPAADPNAKPAAAPNAKPAADPNAKATADANAKVAADLNGVAKKVVVK